LRLDANRAWVLAEAVAFGRAVAACRIEYLEEPLTDPVGLTEFHAATGIPTALDESLQECESQTLAIPDGVAALILKPAVLGGLAVTLAFIRLAAAHRLKCVITSVFESGIGLAALAGLAAAAGGGPHGLDTGRWLGADLLEDSFTADGARIDVDGVYRQSRRLRWGWLERVI
jgi:o-succinylbenzoate synthase